MTYTASATVHSAAPSKRLASKRAIRFLRASGVALAALASGWLALHEIPGVGPLAADTLRSVMGTSAVARLEDTAYGVRDQVNQVLRSGEKPKSYWETPTRERELSASMAGRKRAVASVDVRGLEAGEEGGSIQAAMVAVAPSVPADVGPLHQKVAAPGDGTWVPLAEGEGPVLMHKMLLHPDRARTWAELFVVAIDLKGAQLHSVAGTVEPRSVAPGAKDYQRRARIPESAYGKLMAAFNGGFKTQHGKFGAMVEGVTLVGPKPHSCTIAMDTEGVLKVGTWKGLKTEGEFEWLRQTPGCMVESGELHPGLAREDNKNWGATLSGQTVIRRSALGISEDGETLYVGISNDTTARSLALGMRHAGAFNVAQMDVNYSYPKFIMYDESSDGGLAPRSLVDGFVFHSQQYLKKEARDFFYLTRR